MAGFSLILIGSNQGQRELTISQSIKMLAERCGEVFLLSSLYETEPWGFIAEQNFLNQVVALDTEKNPYDLLRELLMIEKELGIDCFSVITNYRSIAKAEKYYNKSVSDKVKELVLKHLNRLFIDEKDIRKKYPNYFA